MTPLTRPFALCTYVVEANIPKGAQSISTSLYIGDGLSMKHALEQNAIIFKLLILANYHEPKLHYSF